MVAPEDGIRSGADTMKRKLSDAKRDQLIELAIEATCAASACGRVQGTEGFSSEASEQAGAKERTTYMALIQAIITA